MPAFRYRRFTSLGELHECIRPRGFEQAQPPALAGRIGGNERPCHEVRQVVHRVERVDRPVGDDFGCGVHREAAGEDSETTEDRPLPLVQQSMTPVERRAQRLLPRECRACAACEEPEAFIEPRCERVDAKRRGACGRHFDRERDAVEPPADRRDDAGGSMVEVKMRVGSLRTLDEQTDGGRFEQFCLRYALAGNRQRRDAQHLFAGDAERFLRRRQHPQPRCGGKQGIDHRRGRIDHMLAVVDDQQHGLVAHAARQQVQWRELARRLDAQRRRGRAGDQRRVCNRRELDHPHAIDVMVEPLRASVLREPSLADAASTGERHQPARVEQLSNLCEFAFPADKGRRRMRQVRASRVAYAERREVAAQAGHVDLVHADRLRWVVERVRAEHSQRMQVVPLGHDELRRGRRQQDLPAMAERQQPGHAVQRRSEVVVVAPVRRAGVHGHPHRETADVRPIPRRKRLLCRHGRIQRIGGQRECGVKAVSRRLEHVTAVRSNCRSQERVVQANRRLHRDAMVEPSQARAFDVSEQERKDVRLRRARPLRARLQRERRNGVPIAHVPVRIRFLT